MARQRSHIRLIALTPSDKVRNQLSLLWGTEAYTVDPARSMAEVVHQVSERLQSLHIAGEGERVEIVTGMPTGVSGSTNTLRLIKVGEDDRY